MEIFVIIDERGQFVGSKPCADDADKKELTSHPTLTRDSIFFALSEARQLLLRHQAVGRAFKFRKGTITFSKI